MIKQIKTLGGKARVVELPEGAKDPFVAKTYVDEDGHTYDTDPQWLEWSGTFPNNTLDLPPGNWRIIGTLSEVTESEAAQIVKLHATIKKYRDYLIDNDRPTDMFTKTALESLESAIVAGGYAFTNPIPKPDCGCLTEYDREGCEQECWKYINAQSRVLSRERCLLLGREI